VPPSPCGQPKYPSDGTSNCYLPIGQSWRRNWNRQTPFFDYPPEVRKAICTTNAIESVNMGLRKLSKNRGSFPIDEALT
jgi:putative transposase